MLEATEEIKEVLKKYKQVINKDKDKEDNEDKNK